MLFRVDETMTRIRALAVERQGEEIGFVQCPPDERTDDPLRELKARSAVASSLIAVLELAPGGELVATQAEPQASILLSRRV